MSDWKVIVPEATTNCVLNPSAEATGNYAAVGGAVTRVTTYSAFGLRSYRVQTAADNQGATFTLSALANAIHYVTMWVRGTLPASWDWSLDNVNWHVPTLLEAIDADWGLYGHQFPAAEANGSTTLRVYQNGAGAGDFYLDAIQVEAKGYWTTYCDGTQEGCEWLTVMHASTSSRSGQSRAGGRVRDLQDDYGLDIGGMMGVGAPPQKVWVDEYAFLPGGELDSIKIPPRPFTLTGVVRGVSYADLHSKRQALTSVLSPDTYPKQDDRPQPVRLRYTGSAVQKQIAAHYEGGLETAIRVDDPCYWERVSVRFLADDPFWYEVGESAAVLDSSDSATFRIVAARLRSTGQWNALGPPNVAGTYTQILAIAEDDVYVYFGGGFLNFDNIPNADYIVRYNKQTGAWSSLGTGMNGNVWALTLAPDGTLFAGGSFTLAGGVAANYVASWNGAAWSPLGVGTNHFVFALAVGNDGLLFVGGRFTLAGGVAANYVASWNGAAWAALGAGMDDWVYDLVVAPSGALFAGGRFTAAGGVGASRVARWLDGAWAALGAGVDNTVWALAVTGAGVLYVGGEFHNAGGSAALHVAKWDGAAWFTLSSGASAIVYSLEIGPDSVLFAGGTFSVAGGVAVPRMARWNGASWAHVDISLPGPPGVMAIHTGCADPVISRNYDIWVGFDTTGTGYYAGLVSVLNDGTQAAFPRIIISRGGGTSATVNEVRNETIGRELLYSYSLLDGEELTVDLRPTQRDVVSSFFGERFDAVLPDSDLGDFILRPGSNNVTCLIDVAGGPTVEVGMIWKSTYKSF